MKKIIYSFIIIFAVSTFFTSCKKDFLETYPTDAVSADVATATTDNMWAAINGVYRAMYVRYQDAQGCGGIGSFWIVIDCQGEDHVNNAEQWYNMVYKWVAGTNPNYYYNTFPWAMFYQWIANVNVLINNGPDATGPTADKNNIIGQALVIRAWSHFNLVQLYAKRYVPGGANDHLGVPYMVENVTEGQARNTVAQVYTNILADLDAAITLLTGVTRPNKSYPSVDVAKGIKARVLLTMGNYPAAATLANSIKGSYTLMNYATHLNGFRVDSQNVNEMMWAIQITTADQNDLWAAYGAYISRNFSSSAIRGNPRSIFSVLYNQIPATDVRKHLYSSNGQHNGTDYATLPSDVNLLGSHSRKPYTNQKFLAVSNSDSRVDVPLFRASELYLIEAEALARQGTAQEAAARQVLYDFVITRDPDYVLSTNTGQALIDEIMFQRRVELWGEGFRFFDLKRLALPLDRTGGNHTDALTGSVLQVPATDPRWTWLIPQAELDANPLMVQNDL